MKIIIAGDLGSLSWVNITDDAFHSKEHYLVFVASAEDFALHPDADCFIDMGFDGRFFSPVEKSLLINETIKTIDQIVGAPPLLARFCGWPGFCERPVWEIATRSNDSSWISPIMNVINKRYELVSDEPGFVAPRIIAMIINEAFFALAENISSPNEIDMAMKLGTNYPEGPIAWAKQIGAKNIYQLLSALSKKSDRYDPHPLLKTTYS